MRGLDPAHDRNQAHELAQFFHDASLNAFKGRTAQFAENASARELDHNLIAADLDKFAVPPSRRKFGRISSITSVMSRIRSASAVATWLICSDSTSMILPMLLDGSQTNA